MRRYYSTILPFILVSVINSQAAPDGLGKCCDFGQILYEYKNATFACIDDSTKRKSVFVPVINFIKNNPTGSCLDYSTDFYEFQFSDQKIIGKTQLIEDFYPKCCPIGYMYNPIKHSCDPKNNFEHGFINRKLIKVGLPQCHIVADNLLTTLDNQVIPEDGYCFDETSSGFVRRQCTEDGDICDNMRCVKKCCPDGKSFVNGAHCVDNYEIGMDLDFSTKIENPTDPFAIVYNNSRCPTTFYILSERRYQFNLLKNGEFQYWYNATQSFIKESATKEGGGYCIEHSNRKTAKGFFFFHCLVIPTKLPLKFEVTKYPKILSCIFLALTIFIYLILAQTKKLFGKILINYCTATFLMFAILIYAQFSVKAGDVQCKLVGFGIIFITTVSFAWLNVMCCDIWLTFGSTTGSLGVYQRKKDLKKLLGYMAYGWGMPLILSLLIYGLSITESLSDTIRPYIGTKSCFLERRPGNHAQLVFLRMPHLLIQIINAFLFMKTILYCIRIKNEIQRINDNKDEKKLKFNRDKEKLFLILKLAVIMGVTFIFDTVTSFVDFHSLGTFWSNFEIVVDCINCLQGVYIFIIFICKKSIYNDFLKKLHIRRRDAYMNNTVDSFTSSTRISLKNGRNDCRN
ncbi:unnamed protein product [Psylliodes chrysocephalus]|uniref:G-protein coupled receptors family 2 profile 2 domain-containing protein n=1 Tax=Psylliodes chrysocephalus TaxID=3402493 RepID=A0A9P0CKN1_9CUCU|nr:unnamed protein product [Psylliodes chrysocephala]